MRTTKRQLAGYSKVLAALMVLIFAYSCKEQAKPEKQEKQHQIQKLNEEANIQSGEPSTYNYKELDARHKNISLDSTMLYLVKQYNTDIPIYQLIIAEGSSPDSLYAVCHFSTMGNDMEAGDKIPLYIFTDDKVIKKSLAFPDNIPEKCKIATALYLKDDYLFLVLYSDIAVYDKNTLEWIKTFHFDFGFDVMTFINNKIYLHNTNFGLSSSGKKPMIVELSEDNLTPLKVINFNMPFGANMTQMGPKKNVGVWKKGFFISDITRYHIKFYDFNMKLTHQIHYMPDNWITDKAVVDSVERYTSLDKFRIEQMSIRNKIATVEYIDFIDDSTFMLYRNCPKFEKKEKNDQYIDVWRLSNNKWKLLYANLHKLPNPKHYINGKYTVYANYPYFLQNGYFATGVNFGTDITKSELFRTATYGEFFEKIKNFRDEKIKGNILIFKLLGFK